jgi:hypothetical protein
MGPFLGLTLGQYGSYSISRNANGMTTDQSGDLTDTGVHEWLTIGVRGQFNL